MTQYFDSFLGRKTNSAIVKPEIPTLPAKLSDLSNEEFLKFAHIITGLERINLDKPTAKERIASSFNQSIKK